MNDIQREFGVIATEKALEACWTVFIAKNGDVPQTTPKPPTVKQNRAGLKALFEAAIDGDENAAASLRANVEAIRIIAASGDKVAKEVLGYALELLGSFEMRSF